MASGSGLGGGGQPLVQIAVQGLMDTTPTDDQLDSGSDQDGIV